MPESCRLVIYSLAGRPTGSLYPVDATPYSTPLFSFTMATDQPLPRQAPGGIVSVEGPLERGARPLIRAGDVEIRPLRGLVPAAGGDGMRIFGERGNVIGHPAVVGWEPGWRYARSVSFDDVAHWEQRLRRNTRDGWVLVASDLVIVVLLLISVFHGSGIVIPIAVGAGGSAAGTVHLWRRAHAARIALEQAREVSDQPGRPMTMSLTWVAGHGDGPVAIANLFAPGEAEEGESPVSVPVVNVTADLVHADRIPVEVRGDLATRAVSITCGDHVLWPDTADRPSWGYASPRADETTRR